MTRTAGRGIGGVRWRLIPTLFSVGAALLCFALGAWQLERLQWKRGLIAERVAALAAPPAAPPASLAEARALEFHPVVAEGRFLNDKEVYLYAIGAKGGAGFNVLTPLRQPDGRVIFVNRGFVPIERKDPATRAAGQTTDDTRISGLLRLPHSEKPGWFIPNNQPERQEWFWVDLPAIAKAEGIADAAPFYIDAGATPNPGGWPKGGATDPLDLPNNHLQYAITWFSLGVAAIVVHVLSQRSERRNGPAKDHSGNERLS
jgi:surfeit locus 1 family protein